MRKTNYCRELVIVITNDQMKNQSDTQRQTAHINRYKEHA